MIRTYTPAELPQGSPQWHAIRAKRIGASELAAIGGASPHKSAADVWAAKTGRNGAHNPRGLYPEIAIALEPLALSRWGTETGEPCDRAPVLVELDGFRSASLDGWTARRREPVDAKVTLPFTPPWEGLPRHIVLQLLQQAALIEALTDSRLEAAHVAQLDLTSCTLRTWRLPLDAELREMYADGWADLPARWWSAYVAGDAIPPEATCPQVYHRADVTIEREPTDEEADLLRAYLAAEAERAELDRAARLARAARDELRDDLARRLGPDHIFPGLRLVQRAGGLYLAPEKD